ncbi:MAG: LysE family translocator [Pseudomonadota bacterium]
MSIEVWLTFIAATTALLAVPGPVVMLLLGYAVSGGRSVAAAAIPGVVLGDMVAMTLSLLGVGAILQTSASLFFALKLAGAAYLIFLGLKIWTSESASTSGKRPHHNLSRIRIVRDAFLVTALNPKDIMFFVAFLPQFIDPAQPVLPQVMLLELTFAGLVVLSTTAWVLLADRAVRRLRNPKTHRLVSRCGAGWLVGAGILTAASA